jgi:tetratricopeptide (TPR) repeat protein
MNGNKPLQTLKEAEQYYLQSNFEMSLKIVNDILNLNKKDIKARHLKASILLETWNRDGTKMDQILQSKSYFEQLIIDDEKNKHVYLYELGNYYNELANFKMIDSQGKLNQEIINNLEKSKQYYLDSLKLNDNYPQVWINMGNDLDYLGRHLEAMECYDRAIKLDQKHPNSWGNLGLVFLNITPKADNEANKILLYLHAMEYLKVELTLHPDFQIKESLKEAVNKYFSKIQRQFSLEKVMKERLPMISHGSFDRFNLYSNPKQDFKTFYKEFCKNEKLFLNFHFDCRDCGRNTFDLLRFKIIVKISDYKTPYHFIKNLNTILDDYKTARFLLTLSQYRHPDFNKFDKQRYEPDYSLNYIVNVELLKETLIKTINICDKIAFFLVNYINLIRIDGKEFEDSQISFWKGDSIFNQTDIIKKSGYNPDIIGINSIRQDFERGEFENILKTRHSLVHRYFVLHDIVDVKHLTYPYSKMNEPLDDLQYHEDINEFYMLVKKSLRLARNIIFSLYFFVYQEEENKIEDKSEIIPSMYWGHSLEEE